MMHEGELKDKCALCGRLILEASDNGGGSSYDDFAPSPTHIIQETMQNTRYKFDTRECATMFKRFIDVYGKDFQPLLGDKQYISDPFWDRVLPKEDEIKVLRAQEKGRQTLIDRRKEEENLDTERKNASDKNQKLEVVSVMKDSFEVQKLIKQLIQSAKENVSLAIPTTATDLFFSSRPQDISSPPPDFSSFSCSIFFQLLKDVAADNKSLSVKILTNAERLEREKEEGQISSTLGQEKGEAKFSNIQVKHIEQDYSSLSENMVILVVDRRASLAIELEEKLEERWENRREGGISGRANSAPKRISSHRMIKLATYSENKSTVLSYISIFESLWKEIELNEKITSLLAEIKRRENIERDFINMAAHELRAPIQPVLGLAQILQTKKNVDTKEQKELLSVIIRNARRLNILTENLLDLAKIENNTLKLQKEAFNLPELIFEAIADMKSQLSSNQVMINVEYNNNNNGFANVNLENIPSFVVEADKTRIMQVISNLLTNAIKFTRGGRVIIRLDDNSNNNHKSKTIGWNEKGVKGLGEEENVQIEAEAEKQVTVSFIDSGTGIDPGIIGKIFEKFVTKSDKGTGLGLFISKKIVEAHGGNIWAKNNTNAEGATIAFGLPVSSQH